MSQVIDTKVVEMQFDNTKFEKNIEVSLNSLKYLNKSVEDIEKNTDSLDDFAKAGRKVGVSFDNMQEKAKICLNMMDLISGVGTKAFNRVSDAVAGFALNMANSLSGMQAMRDGFAEYELKMGSVQTILAGAKIKNPLWSKETAKEQKQWVTGTKARLAIVSDELEKLNAYSDKTIYSFKDMTSNIGKFTNAGVDLKSAVQAIQGVANVAAISGANANEASRAMYNFAQALSSGTVKLIDWKSIENANMATVGFKQQLLNTAVAMGTVVKKGKKYNTLTKDNNGKTFEGLTATKKFNDSLSAQWLTTEVLTQTLRNYSTDVRDMTEEQKAAYIEQLKTIGYTEKQINQIIKLGKKAFDSATEVKTFSQMMDTLKESLGSGWAQTFEIVIGNFTEAKKLWTSVNNTIDGLLSPIGKARNEILQLWKNSKGRDDVIKTFKNLYATVSNLIAPIKELWLAFTPNTFTSAQLLTDLTRKLRKLTAVAKEASAKIGAALSKLLAPIASRGPELGRKLLATIRRIENTVKRFIKFFSPLVEAVKTFGGVVKEAIGPRIKSSIESFHKTWDSTIGGITRNHNVIWALESLTLAFSKLKLSIKTIIDSISEGSKGYAERFVNYLNRIWDAISPIISSVVTNTLTKISKVIINGLSNSLKWLSKRVESLADFINRLDLKNSKFYKWLADLPNAIKNIAESSVLKNIFTSVKNFGGDAVEFLSGKFIDLRTAIENIKMPQGLQDLFQGIKDFIRSIFGKESVGEGITDSVTEMAESTDKLVDSSSGDKLTAFQIFIGGVAGVFVALKEAAKKATEQVKKFIDFVKDNIPKAAKSLYNFLAGDDGILTMTDLTENVYNVADAFSLLFTGIGIWDVGKAAKGISEAFGEMAGAATTLLKRISNRMNFEAIKDFAIALGILAGALFALSKIPADKLDEVLFLMVILAYGLNKFFSILSTGNMDISKTSGFLPLAALLLAIAGSLIGVAASIGLLILALKLFPGVVKQYNDLGSDFTKGMERVKEVMAEIFEYLDHSINGKYGFRSAAALFALVSSLKKLQTVIINYAKDKTGDAMADGLDRIKKVLDMIGKFLSSATIASINGINIGFNFNTLGMAAIIWAIGDMIKKIEPTITTISGLTPGEFTKAFILMTAIIAEITGFMAAMIFLNKSTSIGDAKVGLGQWLGMAATVTLLASAIKSVVDSLKIITGLASGNAEGLTKALLVMAGIFTGFGILLAIIGKLKPSAAIGTLFGLSLVIGVLTACVMALVPIANSRIPTLTASVVALIALMVGLGVLFSTVGAIAGKTKITDIFTIMSMVASIYLLTTALRRLARGSKWEEIAAAGAAIGGVVLAIAGAFSIMSTITFNPAMLGGLALITAAIWGIVFAIRAFKSSAPDAAASTKQVSEGIEQAEESLSVNTEHMAAIAKDVVPSIFGESLGESIREAIGKINLSETIGNLWTSFKESVKNWGQDVIDITTNLIDGISSALSNPENIERVKESFKGLGKAMLEAFKSFFGINSPSTVMIEQGGYILDGLIQGLMEYPGRVAEWLAGLGGSILDGIKGFFRGAAEKGKILVENIGTGLQNGKNFISKKASVIGEAALKKIGKVKEWGDRAIALGSAFGAKLQKSKSPIARAAGNMVSGAITAVKKTAVAYSTVANEAVSKFSSKIRSGAASAKKAGETLINGAKAAFTNIQTTFSTYGGYVAEGFKNGINRLISSVAEKAREMVRRAKEAAKSEEHASSPSKDFMEYGSWAAEGYALGMANRKNLHMIQAKARAMVGAAKDVVSDAVFGKGSFDIDSHPAINSLAYAMSQISDNVDGSINTDLTIRPVIDMSNINRNAPAISALFGDRSMHADIDATRYVQSEFERAMANQSAALSMKAINRLATKLDGMTETMNSRSLNVYNQIDGASDPSAFADDLIRSFTLNARTI